MKTKDAVKKLMDDVTQLLDMQAGDRDWFWRHEMERCAVALAKLVGLAPFEFNGKPWVVSDDLKSVREVESGE